LARVSRSCAARRHCLRKLRCRIALGNFGGSFARVSRSCAAALRGGIAFGNFGGSFVRVSRSSAAALRGIPSRNEG